MDERFHPAQDALARGDVEGLAALLAADPTLASGRSYAWDHPTLLQCLVLTMPPIDRLEALIDLLADHGAELTDPLIAACGIGNLRAVVRLLDLDARIDGNGQWSPLEEALYFGHTACVALLRERGASVTNLRTAAGVGDLPRVAACFDEAGNPTAAAGEVAWPFNAGSSSIPDDVRRDPRQIVNNALVYAAACDRAEVVDFLLERGGDVNAIPAGFDYAGTPLHYAAFRGHRAMVDHLLTRGADPSIRDTKVNGCPEGWAEHSGHAELAEYLRSVREGVV
jgi:ankyrin repeat protein